MCRFWLILTTHCPKLYDCFLATNFKPAVISRIFDNVDRVLALLTAVNFIAQHVVKSHVSLLLTNLALLVERTKGVNDRSGFCLRLLNTSRTPLKQRRCSDYPYLIQGPSKLVAEKFCSRLPAASFHSSRIVRTKHLCSPRLMTLLPGYSRACASSRLA